MTTSSPSRVLFFFSASGRAIGSSVYMCGDSVDSHAYELMIFNCHGLRTSEGSSQREEIQRLIGLPFVSIADLVAEAPGVSQNGQGGLFQTYSVRGVSRQRILTLVEGMRIVGERRAGVSASFLDPLLLGSVEVVRGPSSTYWG